MNHITVDDKIKLKDVITRLIKTKTDIGVSAKELRLLLVKVTPFDHKEACRQWNIKHQDRTRLNRQKLIKRIRQRCGK